MIRIVRRCISYGVAALVLLAASAEAHHSVAQFDLQKRVSYAGTVTKYEWQNPHVWIWLMTPQKDGSSKEVGIECAAPMALRKSGLQWNSLKVGDKITVTAAPVRDGRDGGLLTDIEWADGHKWNSPFTKILEDAQRNGGAAP